MLINPGIIFLLMERQAKDLNMYKTYVDDIFKNAVLKVKFDGLQLIPSVSAMTEMCFLGIDLQDCAEILEKGYTRRKRAKGTLERWLDKGKKTINVVAVRSYNHSLEEEVYLITHVGRFTRQR